ncbi:hypothetical protein KC573_01060 [candidate division WWE3 bacterium]|uniref:Uncharacterized protein n=1 Tax=candidate division WWE3 bacterium TaxID=2053526 RepID=A0A955RX18_UNCKA|nr:hypothetical protein [candidate division WWE3 bacterium]
MKLMLWGSVLLNDPCNVLIGAGSNTRHLRFYSVDDSEEDVLRKQRMQQFALYESGMKDEGYYYQRLV